MSGRVRQCIVGGFAMLGAAVTVGAEDCRTASRVSESPRVTVSVHSDVIRREPFMLGFNLEAAPFERDFWDPARKQVREPVRQTMGVFRGALVRYPGGTPSNRIDLLATVDEPRPPQLLADWLGPRPVHFGLLEYARFAADLGSPGWLVLNVLGIGGDRGPPTDLATRNERAVARFQAANGILRVELGNELYFPRYAMSGSEYAKRSLATINRLRQANPSLRSVVALAGFDIGPMQAETYNAGVLNGLAGADVDYSFHYYYDGPPGGPPLPVALRNLCDRLVRLEARTGREPAVWITEHGRWPGGKVSDPGWKSMWPASYDLGAALSVSEFVVAIAPWPQIRGAFLHGLGAAGGPWHLLDRTSTGEMIRSAPLLAQSLLQALQGSELLRAAVSAPFIGPRPAVRAIAFRRSDRGVSVLVTHRGTESQPATIEVPEFSARGVRYSLVQLHAAAPDAANTRDSPGAVSVLKRRGQVQFDADGNADVVLPGATVLLYEFDPSR